MAPNYLTSGEKLCQSYHTDECIQTQLEYDITQRVTKSWVTDIIPILFGVKWSLDFLGVGTIDFSIIVKAISVVINHLTNRRLIIWTDN